MTLYGGRHSTGPRCLFPVVSLPQYRPLPRRYTFAMAHLLLVEDDTALARCVRHYLEADGYEVSLAEDTASARSLCAARRHDLAILDLRLPDGEGLDLCREWAARGGPPVVVVSARGDGADRMLALEAGASMYLAKPFDLEELVARVGTSLRLHGAESPGELLTCGDLRVDQAARRADIRGEPLALTPKEFDLLAALVTAAGAILPGEQLLWEIWGYGAGVRTRTLDVHIGRLRGKLAAAQAEGCAIVTKVGVGYGIESRSPLPAGEG